MPTAIEAFSPIVDDPPGRLRPRLHAAEVAVDRAFRLAGVALGRLSRRPALAIGLVGLVSFVLGAGLTLLVGRPDPIVQDEFSYLLGADTFASGRLANPTHPLWPHFETFQVIQRPTYASKYPPAQSLLLAAGRRLGGHPVVGTWIGGALACSAICWMLMAWLPPRWAVLGGLLAAAHPLTLLWERCYWGGSVAAIGGALVLGAARRISGRPRARDACLLALGMAILANTRPYEGLVLSLLAIVPLLVKFAGLGRRAIPESSLAAPPPHPNPPPQGGREPERADRLLSLTPSPLAGEGWGGGARPNLGAGSNPEPGRPPAAELLRRVVLPMALVLGPVAGLMACYNARVTGNPLRMPYMVHEAAYSRTPIFHWQPIRPEPAYQNRAFRDFYNDWELDFFRQQHAGASRLIQISYAKTLYYVSCFQGFPMYILPIVLVMLPTMLRRDRWVVGALLTGGLFGVGLLLETARPQPHYAAPVMGLALLLETQALRRLRGFRWSGRPIGRLIFRTSLVACLVSVVALGSRLAMADGEPPWIRHLGHRAGLVARLEREGGRHLVIVRYSPAHLAYAEWVYNEADIDGSRVAWARELDEASNRRLLDYFRGRQTWLLEADAEPPVLVPYPASTNIEAAR